MDFETGRRELDEVRPQHSFTARLADSHLAADVGRRAAQVRGAHDHHGQDLQLYFLRLFTLCTTPSSCPGDLHTLVPSSVNITLIRTLHPAYAIVFRMRA